MVKSTMIIMGHQAKAAIKETSKDRAGVAFPHILSDAWGTSLASMSTTFVQFSFENATVDINENVKNFTNVGDREQQYANGPLDLKFTIKRKMCNPYWMGMSQGSVIKGTTYTATSYVNEIIGDGSGYYDNANVNTVAHSSTGVGTSNTWTLGGTDTLNNPDVYKNWYLIDSAGTHFRIEANSYNTLTVTGTPVSGEYVITRFPLDKPTFDVRFTLDKDGQPMVLTLTSAHFNTHKISPSGGEATYEELAGTAQTTYTTFETAMSTFN